MDDARRGEADRKHKRRQIDKRNAAAGRMRGLFAHIAPGVSLTDELIANRRTEVRTEEQTELERLCGKG